MRVHVIGASGTFPTATDPGSGYLIESGATRIWCDTGPGTFVRLPCDPDLVDAVFISHRHPDHCTDILTAYHAWSFRPEPREGVRLYTNRDVLEHLAAFTGRDGADLLGSAFDVREVSDGDTIEEGGISVSFVEMNHSAPDLGSLWEADGRTLFFTGDTGPGDWESRLGPVNVMLSEAALQGERGHGDDILHLYAAEAGSIARKAGVDELVLTHIPPYLDKAASVEQAERTFGKPVRLAVPGTAIKV